MKLTSALFAVALAGAPMLSQATTLTLTGTADDSFVAYLSSDLTLDGSDTQFVSGSISGITSDGVNLSGTAPAYVIVRAVNTVGNGPGYAQFVASLSLSDSAYTFANGSNSLLTNDVHWLAGASPNLTGAATASVVMVPDSSRPGSLALAQGIWTPTIVENTTVYFATQVTPAAAVPEPESAALLLGGLAALGWVARRRSPRAQG